MHFLCPPESAVISKMGRETLAKVGVWALPSRQHSGGQARGRGYMDLGNAEKFEK